MIIIVTDKSKIIYHIISSPEQCTKHPWVKGIQVCSNKKNCLFPWGDIYEIAKYNIDEI